MNTHPLFEDLGVLIDGSENPDLMSLDRTEVISLFRSFGLVLFDAFKTDTQKFQGFTDRFSSDYITNKGGGSVREVINKDADRTILSVSYQHNTATQRTFGLPLHSDRSYTKSWPPIMWFHCVVPAATDGETTVCDGVRVYEALSESTKRMFRQKRIKYIRHYKSEEWRLLLQTDSSEDVREYCQANGLSLTFNQEDNSVRTEHVTSAVVKTRWGRQDAFVNSILIVEWQEEELGRTTSIIRFDDGSKIPADVMAEVKAVANGLTRAIPWKPGQIVMIDNTRVMHGRRSFSDPKREIHVRMCGSVDW